MTTDTELIQKILAGEIKLQGTQQIAKVSMNMVMPNSKDFKKLQKKLSAEDFKLRTKNIKKEAAVIGKSYGKAHKDALEEATKNGIEIKAITKVESSQVASLQAKQGNSDQGNSANIDSSAYSTPTYNSTKSSKRVGTRETSEKAMSEIGKAVGGYFGSAGAAFGEKFGAVIGKTLGRSRLKYSGLSETELLRARFTALAQTMEKFDKSILNSRRTVEGDAKAYNDNIKKIKGIKEQRETLEAIDKKKEEEVKKRSKKKFRTSKARDKYKQKVDSYQSDPQIVELEKAEIALKENNEQYRQSLIQYAENQKAEAANIDKAREDYFQERKNNKKTTLDFASGLKEAQKGLAKLGQAPDIIKNPAAAIEYNEKLIELKKQEIENIKKFIGAKEKEIAQMEAFKGQIESWTEGKTQKDWGASEWKAELKKLGRQKAKLDPKSATYQKNILEIQKKQFNALKNIDINQEKTAQALTTAKNKVKEAREKLMGQAPGAKQGMAYQDTQYKKLLAATKTGTGVERAKASTEFSTFVTGYLGKAKNYYKSSKKYSTAFDKVVSDLQQVELRLNPNAGNMNVTRLANQIMKSVDGRIRGSKAEITEVEKGYAKGGIATGPKTGHWELLHGTEAIVPLEQGFIPVVIEGGKSNPEPLRDLLLKNNQLLGELIDVERSKGQSSPSIYIDTKGLEQKLTRNITEGARRGIYDLGTRYGS